MRKVTFEQFMLEVLSLNEPPIRAYGTYRQVRQVLREVAALPCVRFASDLRPTTVAAWIRAYPDRTPVRAASLLRSLSASCRYAVSENYITHSPFSYRRVGQWVRDVPLRPTTARPPMFHSADEVGRLLGLLDAEAAGGGWREGRLQALTYLVAYLGLRASEAQTLLRDQVDLGRNIVSIEPRSDCRLKTRRSAARLPMPDPLSAVLAFWLPRCGCQWAFPGVRLVGPWTGGPPGGKPRDCLLAAGRRAGIAYVNFLSLRKTIGTLAKSWGLGQLELAGLLRHSNVETQRWYDEERTESLRPAVAKIRFGA
jgi:integrase